LQNDCILVRGLDFDDDLDLIDEETIYLPETLPGIKARAWRAEGRVLTTERYIPEQRMS